jgi:hypothetical protein
MGFVQLIHVEKGMTVYITQEMRGRDLTDATTFGDLEILIPAEEQAGYSTQPTIRKINRKLSKFSDDDYILLAGDPAIIALSAAVASKNNNGRFKMLKWDRLEEKYFPLEADIHQRTSEVWNG